MRGFKMVKKLLISLTLILGITPTHAMWSGLAQRASALTQRVSVVAPFRALGDYSWLSGTLNAFPEGKKSASPVVGASLLNGSLGKKIYDEDSARGKFAKTLLHYRDNKFYPTAQPGNPFTTVDTKTLGILCKAVQDDTVEEFLASDVVTDWHTKHLDQTGRFAKGVGSFKREIRSSLKPTKDMTVQDSAAVVAMLGCAKSIDGQGLSDYCDGIGVETKPQKFSLAQLTEEEGLDAEQLVAKIAKQKQSDYSFLNSSSQLRVNYQKYKFSICVEQAIWEFINLVLYNPETQKLDLSLLPSDVCLLPEFKAFIENHNNVQDDGYFENAKDAFVAIVSGISGIGYQNRGCELSSGFTNSIRVLNHLFGIKVQTITQCAEKLSTDQRTISVVEQGHEYQSITVEVKDEDQGYEVVGVWYLGEMHADFDLKTGSKKTSDRALQAVINCEHASPHVPLAHLVQEELAQCLRNLMPLEIFNSNQNAAMAKKIISLPSFDANQVFDDETLLFFAVRSQNTMMVILLLEHGADATKGIWRVVYDNNIEMVTLLLEHNADATEGIWDAVYDNNIEMVTLLLEHNADATEGIRYAAYNNNIEMVELFLKYGADANKGIRRAVDNNNIEMVTLLLEHNADATEGIRCAVDNNNIEMVALMKKHGATE
jgi:hypothetical protein